MSQKGVLDLVHFYVGLCTIESHATKSTLNMYFLHVLDNNKILALHLQGMNGLEDLSNGFFKGSQK
jgi:hypothetical protein